MRKRLMPVWITPLVLLVLACLLPVSAAAASQPHVQAHTPHFFLKGTYQNSTAHSKTNNVQYNGGPVMGGTAHAYAIFWEPTGDVSTNYHTLIERYFGDVGGSQLYQNNTQYKDSNGTIPSAANLAGTWVDNGAYPENPLLDIDIQNEVSRAQSVNIWSSSIDNIFFVFLQRGQNLCFDSSHSQCASNYFCAYHGFFGSDTIYAAMPYAASFSCNPGHSPNHDDADQTINVTSHEQMEAATDPLLNAWYDIFGAEIGDKCAWNFGRINRSGADVTWNGHSYIVQKEWDNQRFRCVLTGP